MAESTPAPETPSTEAVVTLQGVSVAYGKTWALREVTASFRPGAVGLLGPNGAGKSTMIKSLLGFIKPNEGTMRVLGLDVTTSPLEIRSRIGYMPENDGHIPGMNAVSFVAYCGELAGLRPVDAMQRAHEVLYYVGLGEARYRNVETYSTGMKQRIKLAQALVHDPDLLFLDEPTNGMDPKGRDEMLALDSRPRPQQGRQPDPLLAPAARRRALLRPRRRDGQGPHRHAGSDRGAEGPRGRVFEIRAKDGHDRLVAACRAAGFECHETDEDVMRVFVPEGLGAREVFALAAHEGLQLRHLRPSVPTLEDVFAKAVGDS